MAEPTFTSFTVFDSSGKVERGDDGSFYVFESDDGGVTWQATGNYVQSGGTKSSQMTVGYAPYPWPSTSNSAGQGTITLAPTAPAVTISPSGLSATISEGLSLKDNKFERLVDVEGAPTIIDKGTVVGGENWKPLGGLPSTLDASGGVESSILVARGFNFNVPEGADILGITVEVDRTVLGSGDANLVSADEAELCMAKWWTQSTDFSAVQVGLGGTKQVSQASDSGVTWAVASTMGYNGTKTDVAANADGSIVMLDTGLADVPGGSNPGFFRSTDGGDTWAKVEVGANVPDNRGSIFPVRFINGKFWYIEPTADKAWSSTDGLTWTEGTNVTTLSVSGTWLGFDFHYWAASGRYYALASGSGGKYSMATTTDGDTWTTGTNYGAFAMADDPAKGKYIAGSATALVVIRRGMFFGNPGIVVRSTDTAANPGSWSTVSPGGDTGLHCIGFGNGVFIVGSEDGWTKRSTDDGLTWGTLVNVGAGSSPVVHVEYTGSTWVAFTSAGGCYTSADDGASWALAGSESETTFTYGATVWE